MNKPWPSAFVVYGPHGDVQDVLTYGAHKGDPYYASLRAKYVGCTVTPLFVLPEIGEHLTAEELLAAFPDPNTPEGRA